MFVRINTYIFKNVKRDDLTVFIHKRRRHHRHNNIVIQRARVLRDYIPA